MMGRKSSSTSCASFCESVTPSYRRTATYIALHYLLKRGRDPSAPPSDQRVQCARLQGLAQLPRTPSRNCPKRVGGAYSVALLVAEKLLFDPSHSRLPDEIHARSVAR